MKRLEKLVKSKVEHPLSNSEIMQMMDGKTKIVTYPDLHMFGNIDELILPYGNFILLYENKPNSGHWCLIHYIGHNTIEFFDPYGGKIDSQLNWIPDKFKKISNQDYPYLSQLLSDSNYRITSNPYQFQVFKQGIRTCGRWCILRAKYCSLSIQEFRKLFQGKDMDQIAAFLA